MNRTPWQLWNIETGKPAEGADTLEAIEVLETGDAASRAATTIRACSTCTSISWRCRRTPERALRAADALRDLVPDAGHLLHMPTHIDVLCGHYHARGRIGTAGRSRPTPSTWSARGAVNFYSLYRCHDYHFIDLWGDVPRPVRDRAGGGGRR